MANPVWLSRSHIVSPSRVEVRVVNPNASSYPLCPRVHQNLAYMTGFHMEYRYGRTNNNIAETSLLKQLHFIPSRVYPNDEKPTDNLTHCYEMFITVNVLCMVNITHLM
jgi:hypothetical protein